jgi:CRISPR type I-E-associated protein CasB/Cse2
MSEVAETKDVAREFVDQLGELTRGDRARLKRCAGRPLEECTEVFSLLYRLLPAGVRGRDRAEQDYFLVATVFGLTGSGRGDLGEAMRRLQALKPGSGDALDRRLSILLDCSRDELTFRLRQTVRLLGSAEIGLDWAELLWDIRQWERPWKPTQKKWARSYFGARATEETDATEDDAEQASEEAE